jgi:hypothetical protein
MEMPDGFVRTNTGRYSAVPEPREQVESRMFLKQKKESFQMLDIAPQNLSKECHELRTLYQQNCQSS